MHSGKRFCQLVVLHGEIADGSENQKPSRVDQGVIEGGASPVETGSTQPSFVPP
jgi:hypothetical protein